MKSYSGTVTSIAFFNFAGISVTKELSATTRMVLDSIRTLVIWAVSMLIGWQDFYYLQLIGFCILIIGMMLYNDIIILPLIKRVGEKVGLYHPEVAEYRDLETDTEREVQISNEGEDEEE